MSVTHLPALPLLDESRRLLILAPHCDDETLGAGGLIAEARRRNIPVQVAFFTNGDGFPAACALSTKKVNPQSADYVRLGELRQKEALAALARLGVAESDVRFLSYPDRGLKVLWETNWTPKHVFRSRYTAADHSPFARSLTPHAPYCGESVRSDLVEILDTFQPTDVFVTHPADDHADHSAAAAFAQAALEQRKQEGKPVPTLRYYIVHRGDWPLPQGYNPNKPLIPPTGLSVADTTWFTFPLTEKTLRTKTAALNLYHSQMEITGQQLRSFLRSNEIFGTLPEPTLQNDVPGSVRDAVADDVVRYANPATDLTGLSLTQHPDRVEIHLQLRGGGAPGVRYALRIRSDSGVYLTRPLRAPQLAETGHSDLACVIPLRELCPDPKHPPHQLWVSAETGVTSRYIVDQTGYRPFHLTLEPKLAEE